MSRIITAVVALSCALATLTVAPAEADPGVRILLTGDSITHGRHGDYTWRYRLDREFDRQAVPVDLVGSQSSPYVDPGYASSSYADPSFDQDHFAKAGQQLSQMVGTIGTEVAAQNPDVIVLEAGVNDLLHGQSPDQVATSLRAWLAAVRVAAPSAKVLLVPVLSIDGKPDINEKSTAYNAMMRQVADERALVEPVSMAGADGWTPNRSEFSVDGTHLAPEGETFLAQRVAEGLQSVGILPATPQVYRTDVPWLRVERPVVRLSGRVATVTWGHQAITGAQVRIQRAGRPAVTSAGATPGGGPRTFNLVAGATYDFSLRVTRNRLIGPWGPVARVRVAAGSRLAAPARVTVTRAGVRWSASVGASSYVVKFRKAHKRRWITRRTSGLSVRAAHVKVARVQAVGATGHSGWRRDVSGP